MIRQHKGAPMFIGRTRFSFSLQLFFFLLFLFLFFFFRTSAVDVNVAVVVCAQCQTIFISHEIYYQTRRSQRQQRSRRQLRDARFALWRSVTLTSAQRQKLMRSIDDRSRSLSLTLSPSLSLPDSTRGIVINAVGGICTEFIKEFLFALADSFVACRKG